MDPTTTFWPNEHCHARGQTGHGEHWYPFARSSGSSVMSVNKTFSATTGHGLHRLRTSTETVAIIVTLPAHGCPLQAIVAAFGLTSGRSPRGGPVPVDRGTWSSPWSNNHDLGQVRADELRVKKQSGIVWMALAMMVKTRLWLGGEVSAQRDRLDPAAEQGSGAARPGGPS